jgi:hypothetical protein
MPSIGSARAEFTLDLPERNNTGRTVNPPDANVESAPYAGASVGIGTLDGLWQDLGFTSEPPHIEWTPRSDDSGASLSINADQLRASLYLEGQRVSAERREADRTISPPPANASPYSVDPVTGAWTSDRHVWHTSDFNTAPATDQLPLPLIDGTWTDEYTFPADTEPFNNNVEIGPRNRLTNPMAHATISMSGGNGTEAPENERMGTMIGISQAAAILGVDRQRLHYLRTANLLRVEARRTETGNGVRYFVDLDEARQACGMAQTWIQGGNGAVRPLISPVADPANYQPIGIVNANRKFGIEIECMLRSAEGLAEAIENEGLDCNVESYNHQRRSAWKIVTDGSLSSHVSGYRGYELVSPPMSGEDGKEQIRKVARALKSVQAKVNKTCGMHVHHEVTDVRDVAIFKRLVRNYRDSIKPIESVLSMSRRHDTPNRTGYCALWSGSQLAQIDRVTSVMDLAHAIDRYFVINFRALPRQGTVEFRQHHGTLDATKIIKWLEFGQAMIDGAINGMTIATDNVDDLARSLAFTENQKAWWIARDAEVIAANTRLANVVARRQRTGR